MESLIIKKDSAFNQIELSILDVIDNDSLKLRLPNTLKERGVFGIEGLVLLLISTWLRKNKGENIIHTYCNMENPNEFDDLSNSLYGICSMRLSDRVIDNVGRDVEKKIALSSAYSNVKKVVNSEFSNAFKGFYVAVPSIKSKGVNREYNSPFYLNEKVISKSSFRNVCEDIIKSVVPQKGRNRRVSEIIPNVSDMIWELFDNTHKHGRLDELGNVLETNFRGVIFNSVDVTAERLDRLSQSGVPGMLGFAADWKNWMEVNNKNLPVLDITVVDAGPGYARRWTGLNKLKITAKVEVDSVIDCFRKNKTTSNNVADGSGLTHVLTDLKAVRGWFRLRTGSVSVSKSFFMGGDETIEIKEKDIKKCGQYVDGNSFNIVIPLVDFTEGGK